MLSRERQEIVDRTYRPEEDLTGFSHEIHRHPETGFQEYKVMDAIETHLKTQEAGVEQNYYEIPTSFHAVKKGRGKGPVVAFLAEHDTLRGVGHRRDHNVIAACVVGVFLDTASKMGQYGGEVRLLGTPVERGGAGKVLMLERSGFGGVEFALMMHPTGGGVERNYINRGGEASGSITASFRGKLACSSVLSVGTSALNVTISMFNQIDTTRPTSGAWDSTNDAILEGGTAGDITLKFSRREFCIRAETTKRADELISTIEGYIRRAQDLTSAAAEVETRPIYAERYPYLPLCEALKKNMEGLGISTCYPKPGELFGSSDIGNISIRVPVIHDYLSITDDASTEAHFTEYARVAAEPGADEVCVLGVEGLAMTAFDILTDGKLREESIVYHKEIVSALYEREQRMLEGEES